MRLISQEGVRYVSERVFIRQKKAFTFFEVMTALVILSVGLVGIYRAFLYSLNYQQYILTRLHVINVLSDEFARAENILIQDMEFSSEAGEIKIPVNQGSRFFVQRIKVPLPEEQKGLRGLQVKLRWSLGKRSQEFVRGSLIYVKE